MTDHKIILIKDLLESRDRKQKELEYYSKQLEELEQKMFWIQKEIRLTNDIIEMIEKEKIVDLVELVNGTD